jgi:tetratricopeptide (TPR) repeat protein
MACFKLGRLEEARTLMARAKELIEKKLPRQDLEGAGNANLTAPQDWIICQFIRREAEGMIGSIAVNSPPGAPPQPTSAQAWTSAKKYIEDEITATSEQIDQMGDVPGADRLFLIRGEFYARLGQFRNAAADYSQSLQRNPNNFEARFYLAFTQLYLGQEGEYRLTCEEMYRRFRDTADAQTGGQTAKSCFLAPDPVGDSKVLMRLVDREVAMDKLYAQWVAMDKGIAEYRCGHYLAAADWLTRSRVDIQQTIDRSSRDYVAGKSWWESVAAASFFLAMTEEQLHHSQKAQQTLSEARELFQTLVPPPSSCSVRVGQEHWMVANIASREADKMFGIPSTRPTASVSPAPRE